jgi:hypothetical protein
MISNGLYEYKIDNDEVGAQKSVRLGAMRGLLKPPGQSLRERMRGLGRLAAENETLSTARNTGVAN